MSLLRSVRDRFHPLFYLRKIPVYRAISKVPVTVTTRDAQTGFKVFLDLFRNTSWWVSRMELCEEQERASFAKVVAHIDPKRFWDVGANIGLYTLLFKHQVPDGEVIAFEPDDRNRTLLARTIATNGLTGISIRSEAVSDSIGVMAFTPDLLSGSTGSLTPDEGGAFFSERHHHERASAVGVPTTTLDALSAAPPDFIKIDVEGAELMALKGARHVLSEHRPALMLEASVNVHLVAEFLMELEYHFYDMTSLRPVQKLAHNTLALHPSRHDPIQPIH